MTSRGGGASAIRRRLGAIAPERATLKQDLVAGIPGAISSVPDGMAAGVLAGVSPVHGLYASIFGPVGGGLTSSSKLMVITTTSAAALAAGSAVAGVPADRRPEALFLLTLLAGGLMIVAAVLRMGRFTRFVPHSVMIGFLTGVAANIVLGQLPDLVGSDVSGDFALAKAWHLLLDLGSIDVASLAAGVSAIVILVVLGPTRLGAYSSLIALALPTVAVVALGADTVQRVSDVGEIPQGLPVPALPHLSELSLDLVSGAFAVAALVLIQGAGVSESAPNPDGSRAEPNRDFLAQGVGNVLSGLFRGQPVGGSVGQTALSVAAGARGRWAAIFAGAWMAIILLAFSGLVGTVAMPTLAAVLIVAAIGSLRTGQVLAIMRTARISQIAVCATFVATLLLPVAAAVGLGVVFALLMQLNREAQDFRIVELVPTGTDTFVEKPAPPRSGVQAGAPPGHLREPLLRRRTDPAGSPSRPGWRHQAGGRAAAARPRAARGHVVRRAGGLRSPDRRCRRSLLPDRAGPGRPRPGAAQPHGGARRRCPALRGDRRDRRGEPGRLPPRPGMGVVAALSG